MVNLDDRRALRARCRCRYRPIYMIQEALGNLLYLWTTAQQQRIRLGIHHQMNTWIVRQEISEKLLDLRCRLVLALIQLILGLACTLSASRHGQETCDEHKTQRAQCNSVWQDP